MKSAKIITVSLLTTALILGTSPSYAVPNTSFNVKITVNSSCAVGNVNDINFGNISSAARPTSDLKQMTKVSVTCNVGTPYNIVFKTSRGSTNGTGTMTNEGKTKIPYALFSDSGYSKAWGNTIGTNSVSGIASGYPDLYTVYGKVALSDISNPA
ncbi:MAG: spore coat protein U domain-containing protein, partial [Neisseriaceae bacterium]|nr:spore coat protein U domain-containing protein [Neisseriaceae bacterium]